jgi:mono/diheme cytochrome c family protein
MPSFSYFKRLNCAALLGALAISGCSVGQLGASDEAVNKARTTTPPGASAFDRECASCHGRHGEGLVGSPAIMGPGALPLYPRDQSNSATANMTQEAQQQQYQTRPPGQPSRPPFASAQDIFDFVSTQMPLPKKRSGTLSREDYWAIVNFMLISHGVTVPGGGITPENAKDVKITSN